MKATKLNINLSARIASWALTMQGSRENKVDLRIANGGYHQPGARPGSDGQTHAPCHGKRNRVPVESPSKVTMRLRALYKANPACIPR